jgi:hypothetical protein
MSCGSLCIIDTEKLIRNNVGNIHFQLVNSAGYALTSRTTVGSKKSNFETPAYRCMSLGAEVLNAVETSELAVAE